MASKQFSPKLMSARPRVTAALLAAVAANPDAANFTPRQLAAMNAEKQKKQGAPKGSKVSAALMGAF